MQGGQRPYNSEQLTSLSHAKVGRGQEEAGQLEGKS